MEYIYFGQFTPPFGGVTIKNELLFNKLIENIKIRQCNYYIKHKNIILRYLSIFNLLFSKNKVLVIGISNKSLILITSILYMFNKTIMNNSIVMVMGGTLPQMIVNKKNLHRKLKQYKHIYVETHGMESVLKTLGIINVSVFPNCRQRPQTKPRFNFKHDKLKCLYFSLISRTKGADNVIKAIKDLNNKGVSITVDFYGHIDPQYKITFENQIKYLNNVRYKGVFQTKGDNVYKKMEQYDILLFPTKWKNEGVPGVLIESKIAGLPSIVSNINYNKEIVEDGISGFVLLENTPENLGLALEKLNDDKNLLLNLKRNAVKSSEKYFVDNYLQEIINMIVN